MKRTTSAWSLVAIAACAMALGWPVNSSAQSVSGQARAAQVTVGTLLGITTSILADTGTLNGPADARHASTQSGSIGSLLTAETLHATAIVINEQIGSVVNALHITIDGVADVVIASATLRTDSSSTRPRPKASTS